MKYIKDYKLFEKKITKKESDNFNKEIEEILFEYGAKPNIDVYGKWIIDTIVGSLYIVRYDDNQGSDVYSIFMRFNDVNKAKDIVDCNPYSGKWNIHSDSYEDAILQLEDRLESIKK